MSNRVLGDNIKTLRVKYGLNQEELGKKLNVSSQAISKWELNDVSPSLESLVEMSKLFYTTVDSLLTGVETLEELNNSIQKVNFKLRQLYFAYNRNDSYEILINEIIATILPIYNSDKDYFWIYSARVLMKAVIYAMLEDKAIKEKNFNVQTIKDILQFANMDENNTREQIKKYFEDKSAKCKEMAAIYLNNAQSTAQSIKGMIITYVNLLSY